MTTPPVLERIGRLADLPPDQISAVARTTASVPIALTQPGSEERADQIRDSQLPYRLELQAMPTEPILEVFSQAPSAVEAVRLADASISGLKGYLRDLAREQGFPKGERPRLHQLGDARGGVVNSRTPLLIGGFTFLVGFGLTFTLSLCVIYVRRRWTQNPSPLSQPGTTDSPARRRDDWPRTTRVLPWMLAAFIAMLWLVPFNTIELAASVPVDLKLDRLVLPFIVVAWLLAFARSRRAPSLRLTWIHIALGAFVACAFLSVVLNAGYLNQTLELELAVKKLPLLVGYVLVFVMVASAIRLSEVRPFMTYTLGLAVICGIGIIWEYRLDENLFIIWSERLLPGGFTIAKDLSGELSMDSLGRPLIAGPAQAGVEAVAMLGMALPIALVGLMRGNKPAHRLLYGLAACVLIAAIFATGRKSALLAPLIVLLTVAYFRRRELLSLAPLGLVIAFVVTAISPGAIHGSIAQFFRPDAATVATTSDRTADYDAIRPDLWTHLLFGRGSGSYNHETYRIIDSEILGRTIETGVIGLAAFLMVGVSVFLVARPTIISGDRVLAPLALIGAAASTCFLLVSTLFDVLSFPHATYIFLYIAGLVAVVTVRAPASAATMQPRMHGRRLRGVQRPDPQVPAALPR